MLARGGGRDLLRRLTTTHMGYASGEPATSPPRRPLAIELSCFERLREVHNTVGNATWDKPGPRQRLIAELLPCIREAQEMRLMETEHALRDLIKALEEEEKVDVITLDEMANLVGVDTWDTIRDRAADNVNENAWNQAKYDWEEENRNVPDPEDPENDLTWYRLDDEFRDPLIWQAEEEITDEGFKKYASALHYAFKDEVLAKFGLTLKPIKFKHDGKTVESGWEWRLWPVEDRWRNAASLIYQYIMWNMGNPEDDFTQWVKRIGSHKDACIHFLDSLVGFYNEGSEMSAKRVFERNFDW